MNITSTVRSEGRPIISLHKFCSDAGISAVTAWRWRRKGWLGTVNIYGRQYITEAGLAEFLRRAESGEFAVVSPVTSKPASRDRIKTGHSEAGIS